MKLLNDLIHLSEDATGAGAVAAVPGSLFSPLIKRKNKAGIGRNKIQVIRFKHETPWTTKPAKKPTNEGATFLASLLNEFNSPAEFDPEVIHSQLSNSADEASYKKNSTGFLVTVEMPDGERGEVRVYVANDNADEFQQIISSVVRSDTSTQQIEELLYNIRDRVRITYVEWPRYAGDEEEEPASEPTVDPEQIDATGDQPDDGFDDNPENTSDEDGLDDLDNLSDDDLNFDEPAAASAPEDTSAVTSTLDKVIAMLQANADAQKADAEARRAEAEAREAEAAARIAQSKIAGEQEALEAENYFKDQQEQQKQAKQLQKIARYRQETGGRY